MVFDYSYKPAKEDIIVSLFINNCDDIYAGFDSQLEEYTQKFGITCLPLTDKIDTKYEKSLFRHILILDRTDDVARAMEQYKKLFCWYNCISIAFVYSSKEAMNKANETVTKLKLIYGDQVNFLRPDTEHEGSWFCSKLKILDNAVCDTIRIKYVPEKIADAMPVITPEVKNYFHCMATLFTNYKLYHRSASDGFFAARVGNGIMITATKTYKDLFSHERISYIHDYDEVTNTLSYSGKFLPSSDSVEAWVVFKENPDITAIVHTHASEFFTRNPKYTDRIRVGKGTYGDPLIGHEINKCVRDYLNDFIILEEHGEYFSFTLPVEHIAEEMERILQKHVK